MTSTNEPEMKLDNNAKMSISLDSSEEEGRERKRACRNKVYPIPRCLPRIIGRQKGMCLFLSRVQLSACNLVSTFSPVGRYVLTCICAPTRTWSVTVVIVTGKLFASSAGNFSLTTGKYILTYCRAKWPQRNLRCAWLQWPLCSYRMTSN